MRTRTSPCLAAIVPAAAVSIALSLGAAPAGAAPNIGPSTALEVTPGVPFAGDWTATARPYEISNNDHWHWYRPTFPLRTGDVVQLAIDNAGQFPIGVCLSDPADEFSAAAVLRDECWRDATQVSGLSRERLVYRRSRPNGFLVVSYFTYGEAPVSGQYTITIERVITRVNIGMVPPNGLGQRFALRASLRYGDNTVVADGIPALLQYRPLVAGRRTSFKMIAKANSAASTATFSGKRSATDARWGQVKACAEQPGGGSLRCTKAYRVRVR